MRYTVVRQDRNGVRVRKTIFLDGGSTVQADCHCFGLPFRTHSNPYCSNIRRDV